MRTLKTEELELVAGGDQPPENTKKGNNGWGNGAEGLNNGSDEGGTAESKTAEAGEQNQHDER
ncbi:hypothetical protein GCM10027034_38560 [Ramlibacter solisilvae]